MPKVTLPPIKEIVGSDVAPILPLSVPAPLKSPWNAMPPVPAVIIPLFTVAPVTTAEYGVSKAARPFNSRLDKSKLVENGFKPLPTWQDALHRYLQEIEF